jgi:hypothetical protein
MGEDLCHQLRERAARPANELEGRELVGDTVDVIARVFDGDSDFALADVAIDPHCLGLDVDQDHSDIWKIADGGFDRPLAMIAADRRDGIGASGHEWVLIAGVMKRS